MRTLVYHPGALGDTLLSLPCIRVIREAGSWVHFMGRGDAAELLKEAGCVQEASSVDDAAYVSLYGRIDESARSFLSRFDRAFLFTAHRESEAARAIGGVVPHVSQVLTIPPDDARLPVAEYRLSQIDRAGSTREGGPLLTLPERHRTGARALLRSAGRREGQTVLALHPGSGGKAKCWPLERYFELAARLEGHAEFFILFFSGPAEDRSVKAEIDCFCLGKSGVLHAKDMKLMDAASLLSACRLFVGNDSGFTHLAAALGATVIALFGPTDPVLWSPRGRRVEVLAAGQGAPIDLITVDAVVERAVRLLASGVERSP